MLRFPAASHRQRGPSEAPSASRPARVVLRSIDPSTGSMTMTSAPASAKSLVA